MPLPQREASPQLGRSERIVPVLPIRYRKHRLDRYHIWMTQASPLELYRRFVEIIDQAADTKNIYAVPEAAEAVGMIGGEESRTMSQRWNYTYTDGSGIELHVHARWWDSSKPFSTQPDIHVMRAELKGNDMPMSHERRYETSP